MVTIKTLYNNYTKLKLLTGVSQVQERGVYCATKTNAIMGFVTSRMFLDSYFDKNIKPKVIGNRAFLIPFLTQTTTIF